MGGPGPDFSSSGKEKHPCCCEHGSELSGSIKCWSLFSLTGELAGFQEGLELV